MFYPLLKNKCHKSQMQFTITKERKAGLGLKGFDFTLSGWTLYRNWAPKYLCGSGKKLVATKYGQGNGRKFRVVNVWFYFKDQLSKTGTTKKLVRFLSLFHVPCLLKWWKVLFLRLVLTTTAWKGCSRSQSISLMWSLSLAWLWQSFIPSAKPLSLLM